MTVQTEPRYGSTDTGPGGNRRGHGIHPDSPSPSTTEYVPFGDDKGDAEAPTGQIPPSSDPFTTTKNPQKKKKSFRQHLGIFWSMSLPYFRESGEARCLFGILIVLMLLDSAARIAFSYLARDFWSALGDKDADQFYRIMKNFLVALCLLAPINVFYRFQRQKLGIRWRQWMTERILELYFYNPHRIYYQLEHGVGGSGSAANPEFVDNPDQRLAEDVRSFTQYSLTLFMTVAISVIDLTAFSVVLYTIEPKLFVSIIGFAFFGTLATWLLGRDLVRLNFQRLSREADFRYSLVRLRENAESIAFFRGEHTEGREVRRRFDGVLATLYQVIGTQRNLEFFTVSYNYLTWILPVVVIAPQYMEGLVELGVVQQAANAFGHILDDLSLIINEFEDLSAFSASIDRLHQFIQAVKDADPDRRGDDLAPLMGHGGGRDGIIQTDKPGNDANTMAKRKVPLNQPSPGDTQHGSSIDKRNISLLELPALAESGTPTGSALSIRDLCLFTPNSLSEQTSPSQKQQQQQQHGRILVSNLDFELKWGQKLLIIGPSGIGKSSLLRAIAGLWKSGSGCIERAHVSDVYFLPQKPYCPLGSLRDQLLYPYHGSNDDDRNSASKTLPDEDEPDDTELLKILARVDLPDLAKRSGEGDPFRGLDTVLDWGNVLSLGEQQRLAFGRILVHKPRLVILDEATSAMDVPAEATLYGLLGDRTCVSVGHRPTLLRYHDTRLKLHKIGDDTIPETAGSSSRCNYTIGTIRSTAEGIASEEVDLFFR